MNRQFIPTYAKRYFSDVDSKQITISADNISAEDLQDVIEEATEAVAETEGREFAKLFYDNFTSRLFTEIEEKEEEGGEVDLDKVADEAINETKAQAYDAYSELAMYADEEDEDEEARAQAYFDAGYEAATEMFADLDYDYDTHMYSNLSEDEMVAASSSIARKFSDVWVRVFADAKAEGASDKEAAAEATEEAAKATNIAEEVDEDEVADTKVQSLFYDNPALEAFTRAYAEAKEEGADDDEAAVEGAKAALDEAGVDHAEVDEDDIRAQSGLDFIDGDEMDDEDYEDINMSAADALLEQTEHEDNIEDGLTKTQSAIDLIHSDSKTNLDSLVII